MNYGKWTETRKKGMLRYILIHVYFYSGILLGFILLFDIIGSFIFNFTYAAKIYYPKQVISLLGYVVFVFVIYLLGWYTNEYKYKKMQKKNNIR